MFPNHVRKNGLRANRVMCRVAFASLVEKQGKGHPYPTTHAVWDGKAGLSSPRALRWRFSRATKGKGVNWWLAPQDVRTKLKSPMATMLGEVGVTCHDKQ